MSNRKGYKTVQYKLIQELRGFQDPRPCVHPWICSIYAIKDGLQKELFNGRLMQTEFSATMQQ